MTNQTRYVDQNRHDRGELLAKATTTLNSFNLLKENANYIIWQRYHKSRASDFSKNNFTMTKTKEGAVKKKAAGAGKGKVSKLQKSGSNGPTSQKRILFAIAQQRATGVEAPLRTEIATKAGIRNQGSFSTICGRMKKKELIEYPDEKTIKLTEKGLSEVGPELAKLPKTNQEIQDNIRESITRAKCRAIFDLLADGKNHTVKECADLIQFDFNSPSFKTYLGCLNKYTEKIDGPDGSKTIRLNDDCFPFGR